MSLFCNEHTKYFYYIVKRKYITCGRSFINEGNGGNKSFCFGAVGGIGVIGRLGKVRRIKI